jgi:hypothetical protein
MTENFQVLPRGEPVQGAGRGGTGHGRAAAAVLEPRVAEAGMRRQVNLSPPSLLPSLLRSTL